MKRKSGRATSLALGLVSAFAFGGCVNMHGMARDRYAAQFRCSSEQMQSTDLGGFVYLVEGCGHSVTYVCEPQRSQTRDHSRCIVETIDGQATRASTGS